MTVDSGGDALLNNSEIDDVRTEADPLPLRGQVAGGIVQSLGRVLMEERRYYRDSGQSFTASFMRYAMLRADDLCPIEIGHNLVPTKLNPLGAEGASEAGTVGALAATMNAIADSLGTTGVDIPATPEKAWRALRAQRA